MQRLLPISFFFLLSTLINGQNMVSNYSFETLQNCPSVPAEIGLAMPWFNPYITTSDLFASCANSATNVSVPINFGGDQTPWSGNNYAGLIAFSPAQQHMHWREYLVTILSSPMQAGACYYAEMYVSLGELSDVGIDKLGMTFSDNQIPANFSNGTISSIDGLTPQVYNTDIIIDLDKWEKISGFFIADGGEQVLTIGVVSNQQDIQYFPVEFVPLPPWPMAYYYIENVFVTPIINNQQFSFNICPGDCVTIFDQEYCSEGEYPIVIASCNGGSVSATVKVLFDPEPSIELATPEKITCTEPVVTLDASQSSDLDINSYFWSGPNGFYETTAIADVEEGGIYTFTMTTPAGCSYQESVEVLTDNVSPVLWIFPLVPWNCISATTTLSANSSEPNSTFLWEGPGITNSPTNNVITVNQPGVYTLVVTGLNACTATEDIIVPDDYFFIPDAIAEVPSIIDCNNPTSLLLGSSNVQNPSFLWTGPQLSVAYASAETDLPGNYTFTVTYSNGCTNSTTVTVGSDLIYPDVNASYDTLNCILGTIELTGSTSSSGAAINWSGPGIDEETEIIEVYTPGTYTFTAALPNGCSSSTELEITDDELLLPIVNIEPTEVLSCTNTQVELNGSNSIGNNLGFIWRNSSGQIIAYDGTTTVSTAGIYTLVITDSNTGCSATDQVSIIQDALLPTADAGQDAVINCNNNTVTLNGGNSTGNNLSYEWQNADGLIIATTVSTSVNTSGTYTLLVTDSDSGCSDVDQMVINQNASLPTANAGLDAMLNCINTSATLNGSSSIGNNLGYQWQNASGQTIANTATTTVLTSGTYTLIVTQSSNGCSATDQVVVTQDASLPTANAGSDAMLNCNNTSATLNGSSSIGNNLSYQWQNASGQTIANTATTTVLTSGTYTLIVTQSSNGCSATDQVVVTQDASLPTANAGSDAMLNCNNTSATLNGSSSIGNNLSYQWQNASGQTIANTATTTVLTSGTYTLIVTQSSNGCSATDQVVVTQDASLPTANAGSDAMLNCNNTSATLNGSSSIGNNLSYQWQNASGQTIANTATTTVLTSGTYTLIVTQSSNGCSATDQVVVTQDASLPTANAGSDAMLNCNNTSATLNGSSTIGNNLSYQWQNASGQTIATTASTTVLISGTYTLIVTESASGCSSTDQVTVTQDASLPTANAGLDAMLNCNNTSATLNGSSTIGNNLSYQWQNASGQTIATTASTTVLISGTYTLIVTESASGCSSTDQVTVTQDASLPTANAGLDAMLNCNNTSATLNGSSSMGNNLSYQWQNSSGQTIANTATTTVLLSGTYTLIVTESASGCSSADQVIVNQDASLPTANAGLDAMLNCNNTSATLNGSSSIGNNLSYQWQNASGQTIANTPNTTVLLSGTYTLIVTESASGCSSADQVIVNQDASLPTANAGLDAILNCNNTSATLNGSSSIGNNLSYQWQNASGQTIANTANTTVLLSGTYTLIVTESASGCSSVDQVIVNQNTSQPTANAGLDAILNCVNTSATLNGSSSIGNNLSYQWQNASGQTISTTANATVLISGTYTLMVTESASGCSASDQVVVTQDASLPTANAGLDVVLNCNNTSAILNGSSSIGNNLSYQWQNANGQIIATTANTTVLISGMYTLIVTESASGCSSVDQIIVSQDASLPMANAGQDAMLNCINTAATLNGAASIGNSLSFEWQNASGQIIATSASTTVLLPSTYTLIVTESASGCSSLDQVIVSQDAMLPTASAGLDVVLNCNNTSAILNGNSSIGNSLSYQWQNASGQIIATSASTTVLIPGTYTLIVTESSSGCSSSDQVIITQDASLPTANAGQDAMLSCINTSASLNGSSSIGSNLSYVWQNASGQIIATSASTTVLISGTYTLIVTESASGCSSSDQVIITQDASLPTANAGQDAMLNCNNTSATLNGNSSVGSNLSFEWQNTSGQIIATTVNTTVLISGTYTLIVTEGASGCSSSDQVIITQNASLPTANAGQDAMLSCINTAALLNGNSSIGSNLSFEWQNASGQIIATTANTTVLISGTYTLIVTESASGCSSSDQVIITQDVSLPTASAGQDAMLSCINTAASLNGNSSIGNNLSYEWQNASGQTVATTASTTVLISGTYTLIVTESNSGCTDSDQVIVSQDASLPTANAGEDEMLTCNNTSATLNGSSSIGNNLSYQWQNASGQTIATTASTAVLISGTYTLIVTESASGCSASDQVIVTQDASLPTANAGQDEMLTCNNTSAILNGSSSIGNSLNYQWQNASGQIIATTASMTVLISGTYTLIVTESASGCSSVDQVIVNQDASLPTANAGLDAMLNCNNTFATLNGSSSIGNNLSYEWQNTSGQIIATTASTTVLISGTYTLIVTESASGCSSIDQIIVSQDASLPTANAGQDAMLNCNITSATLNGSSSIGNNLSYEWQNASGQTIATMANTTVLISGTYTLIVTESGSGCSSIDQVIVSQDASLPTANAGQDAMLNCNITSATLNGSSSIGNNLSYEWLNASGQTIATTASTTVLNSGTYTLIVTESTSGCSSIDQVIVSQDASLPTANAGQDAMLNCNNTSATLNGSSSIGNNLSYEWLNASGQTIATTASTTVLNSGTYTLIVTESTSGCSSIDQVIVSQDASLPTANAGQDAMLNCNITSATLNGSSSIGNNLSYEWQNASGQTIATTANTTVLISGTYTLIVMESSSGCSSSDDVLVTENLSMPTAIINTIGPSAFTCINESVILDGSSSLPIGGLAFVWNTTNGNILGSNIIPQIESGEVGVYTLLIIDLSNGCTSEAEISLMENVTEPIAIIAEPEVLTCDLIQFALNGNASSAGIDYTYTWTSNPSGGIVSGLTSSSPLINQPGTYSLTVTNTDSGCEATAMVEVGEDTTHPVAVANAVGQLDCEHEWVSLNGNGTSTGQNFIYDWSGPGNVDNATTLNPNVDAPGVYTLQVTNLLNGCTQTTQVVVTEAEGLMNWAELMVVEPDCFGDVGLISVLSVTGGEAPYRYSIDGINFSDSGFFTSLQPGNYTLMVEDVTGCIYEQMVEIPFVPEVGITIIPELTIEFGETDVLNAITNIATPDIAIITWTPAAGLSCSDCLHPIASPSQTTRYNVTITNTSGCTAEASILLKVTHSREVYIPNSFSPNGDGNNELFMIYARQGDVLKINTFQVYNRWGEEVFTARDFQPNDPSNGWDGSFRGEIMNNGVMVYYAEILFKDGTVELYKGDVTLMK